MNNTQPEPSSPQNDDNIFLTKVAPPPTPDEKKHAALVITIGLIIGFATIIVGIFMLLFVGANSAASSYNTQTAANISRVTSTVKSIDVDAILNQKDISDSIRTVEKLQNDRPRLASVLFAESLSAAYKDAEESQVAVNAFYQKMASFTQELPGLLTFAQAIEEARSDLATFIDDKTITKGSEARAIAGSIDDLAARVKDLSVPVALKEPRDLLASSYSELAEGYRDLASSFTDTASSKAQAKRRMANAVRAIDANSDSSTFASRVKEYVRQLDNEAQTLINSL